MAPQATDAPGVAGLLISNPTSVPFVGTVTPPPGFTAEPTVTVGPRGRVVVKLTLDAPASAKPAEVTGSASVSNAACPGREARATVKARGSGRAVGVAAGDAHSCLLDAEGAVWCWGDGRSGQLGVTSAGSTRPQKIPELASGVTAVRAGAAHTCALRGGKVLCWGAGDRGQLGTGVVASRATPVEVPGVDGVVALAAGGSSTCAVRGDGHMSCWGADVRMSEAAGSGIATPTEIFAVANVSLVSVGRRHACLLRTDGTVGCWGNAGSWLGDGTSNGADVPVTVPGLANVTSIAVGETHTCAGSASSIACWGDSRDLGLLDGTTPGVVASPRTTTGAKLLCAGWSLTCVLIGSSETPTCWGAKASARFASTIAACGRRHACFVRNGAGTPSIECGGDDDFGQAPVSVEGF